MERLTISLDDELAGALEDLHQRTGESKANIVRRALRMHARRRQPANGGRPTERDLQIWTELLAHREHIILDVAHVQVLFQHLVDAPPEFWHEIHEIGVEHWRQYRDKGMGRVEDILQIMESANWLILSPESDHSWTLVLNEATAKPFVRAFLVGFYAEHPADVEVVEERLKLRVRVRDPSRAASSPMRGRASRSA